ncbi:MAG: histidine kinase [Saprospiraceae bacterium]|nr:histidine kinase [Saprospiraceae bacterium]
MNWFLISLLLVCLMLISYQQYIIFKSRSAYLRDQLEIQLKMNAFNPNSHFAFNSLNSIKNLILKGQVSEASNYLTTYSKVVRYNNSSQGKVFSMLKDEMDNLLLFTELERLRFQKGIEFHCYLDHTVDQNAIWIPSNLIQPIIEQLIWCCLDSEKATPAQLVMSLSYDEGILECIIRVNSVPPSISNDRGDLEDGVLLTQWLKKRIAIFNKWKDDQILIKNIELIDSEKNERGMEIIIKLAAKSCIQKPEHLTIS